MNDGSAIGIQAKYFQRVRDIDWVQIDESVKATLKNRSEVNVYRVAIACDLTDRGGVKGQGRTGWAAWDDRVKRWQAEALSLGRSVVFEPITASDLVDWLGQPSAAGLARYWFGRDVLSLPWFSSQVRIASADLGERYTPDRHVVVTASHAFDGVARTASLRLRLFQSIEATWKDRVAPGSAGLSESVIEAAGRADGALMQVHALADVVDAPAPAPAIFRQDGAEQRWITLYSFQRGVERYSDRDFVPREIGLRRECFLFVQSVLVSQASLGASYAALTAAKNRDATPLKPSEQVDGPFLGEYPWRPTWPQMGWTTVDCLAKGAKGLKPVVDYWWESHLDASRPDGLRFRFPAPELLRLLGLEAPSARSPHVTKDAAGRPVIVHRSDGEGSYSVSVRREAFERLLLEKELGCLWFVFGERSAWPTGGHDGSTRRWFGRHVQFDGLKTRSSKWETPW